jgi:hypothetical protein
MFKTLPQSALQVASSKTSAIGIPIFAFRNFRNRHSAFRIENIVSLHK